LIPPKYHPVSTPDERMREIVALALAVNHTAREEGIFQEPSELDDNIAGLLE